MTTSSDQWFMPKQWHWIEYPVGWLEQLNWIGNAPWPGDDGWKSFQAAIAYARLLVKEIHWVDLGGGDKPWPDIEYTPLGGILFLKDMSKRIDALLMTDVAVAQAQHYSWTKIGAALGVSGAAAHKHFRSATSINQIRETEGEQLTQDEDGLEQIRRHALLPVTINTLLNDLVVQARCEGFKWDQIGEALGVSLKSAHNSFSRGLTHARVDHLDEELVWLKKAAPDGLSRDRYVKRLEIRRQERLRVRWQE